MEKDCGNLNLRSFIYGVKCEPVVFTEEIIIKFSDMIYLASKRQLHTDYAGEGTLFDVIKKFVLQNFTSKLNARAKRPAGASKTKRSDPRIQRKSP
jgi:hypothetical protein